MDKHGQYRNLPSVDRLTAELEASFNLPRPLIVQCCQQAIDATRAAIAQGKSIDTKKNAIERCQSKERMRLRPVLNATGIPLHTNLGRAPIASKALTALEKMGGYINLEWAEGQRGDRAPFAEAMVCALTGAEAAIFVNNCASAVWLICKGLADGKDVVISRSELVQIGGGFRIPDVIRESGCRLREVGTTNITTKRDFEALTTSETGMILKVHQSNYTIEGHTEAPTITELVEIGRKHNVPIVYDLGSGGLHPWAGACEDEPLSQSVIQSGIDAMCLSGDKLIGGPQVGIIAGRREIITKLRRHPLMRALRLGKLNLFTLETTLEMHLSGDVNQIPLWKMMNKTYSELKELSLRTASEWTDAGIEASVVDMEGTIGGGAAPSFSQKTPCIAVTPPGRSAGHWTTILANADIPVACRQGEGQLLFDLRTIDDVTKLSDIVIAVLSKQASS